MKYVQIIKIFFEEISLVYFNSLLQFSEILGQMEALLSENVFKLIKNKDKFVRLSR